MVQLGVVNSRMKDFYDLLVLARTVRLRRPDAGRAVARTFENRRTVAPPVPFALTPASRRPRGKRRSGRGSCGGRGSTTPPAELATVTGEASAVPVRRQSRPLPRSTEDGRPLGRGRDAQWRAQEAPAGADQTTPSGSDETPTPFDVRAARFASRNPDEKSKKNGTRRVGPRMVLMECLRGGVPARLSLIGGSIGRPTAAGPGGAPWSTRLLDGRRGRVASRGCPGAVPKAVGRSGSVAGGGAGRHRPGGRPPSPSVSCAAVRRNGRSRGARRGLEVRAMWTGRKDGGPGRGLAGALRTLTRRRLPPDPPPVIARRSGTRRHANPRPRCRPNPRAGGGEERLSAPRRPNPRPGAQPTSRDQRLGSEVVTECASYRTKPITQSWCHNL